MDLITPANVLAALIAVNFATFAAFGIDKMLAEAGKRRISEAALLQLAFIGGTPGAYAGRAVFRHKTRKQPFSTTLHDIGTFQFFMLIGLTGWLLDPYENAPHSCLCRSCRDGRRAAVGHG